MPSINIYVQNSIEDYNVKSIFLFFRKYLSNWDIRFKNSKEILTQNPSHILFPGGRGSKFAERLEEQKLNEITDWVNNGGSFIGICAGAYLACNHLKITTLELPDKNWKRGKHLVGIKHNNSIYNVMYNNGPVFKTNDSIETWATYQSNYIAPGGYLNMLDTPAITYNKFGLGQVLLFSPHLESKLELKHQEQENKKLMSSLLEKFNTLKD